MTLLSHGEPAIEIRGGDAPVPHLVGGKDGVHHRVEPQACEPRDRDESHTLQLGKRYRHPIAQPLQHRLWFGDRIPFIRREHRRTSFIGDQPSDCQILPLEGLAGVDHHDHRFGEADGAQRVADRKLLELPLDPGPAAQASRIDEADRTVAPRPIDGDCIPGDPRFGPG